MTTFKIEELIEKLTINGTEVLDPKLVRSLQEYCDAETNNNETFKYLYRLIYHRLKEKHAQIRFSAFLVVDFLFRRSHLFRELICQHVNSIFEQCLGSSIFNDRDFGKKPPKLSTNVSQQTILKPKVWAEKLKTKLLEHFRQWHSLFGKQHSQLEKSYQLLVNLKLIPKSCPELTSSTKFKRASLKTCRKFVDLEQEINLVVSKIDSCFESLIPKINLLEETKSNPESTNGQCSSDGALNFRPMQGLSINIILVSKIQIIRDPTNADLIDKYQKYCKELNVYDGKLKQFLLRMRDRKELPNDKFKNRIKTIKMKIASILSKGKDIKIIDSELVAKKPALASFNQKNNHDDSEEEEDDDDDFEEVVEKEDQVLMTKIMQAKQTAEREEMAPKKSANDHQCRARLPSGRLCPRKDVVNCPFHGKIIPRDLAGLPLDPELKKQELESQYQKESDEWKDPKYLKVLSERLGKNLEMGKKRKKRKLQNQSNLIDLKSLESTPKKRLQSRLKKISSC